MLKSGRGGATGAVAFILLALAVAPGTVAAKPRPGSLDRSFGRGGRVTSRPKRQSEDPAWPGFQIAPLPGGGVMVLASRTLTRFEADGSRDRRFGRNGAILVNEVDGVPFQPSGLAVDSRGRVLLAGTSFTTSQPGAGDGFGLYVTSATLMRYTAHGTLDPSFGNSGVFSSSFEFQPPVYRLGGPTYHYESPAVEATGVAVDSTDRPVLTGTAVTRMAGCRDIAYGSVPFHESFVARLTTEGKPDPTFNGTGVRPDEAQFSAEAPVAGSSNAVVYLRSVGNECGNLGGNAQTEGVGELTAAGLPNPAFGPDEVGGFQDAAAIAIDRRGRIVLLRDQYNWEGVLKGPMVQVVRLLPNGSADASFGRRGTATFRSKGFVFNAIATDGHQRVLLAGDRDEKNRVSLGVFRLRPNGSPERRFGHRGRAIILLGKRQGVEPSPIGVRIAVDRRERVLVGQYWNWTGHSGSHFAVARFMP